MSGRAVFVLGMHRSGTSAITRVVNLLGVPVAAETDRRPADDENPRGFWEVPVLTRINARLLNVFGGAWIAPPVLAAGWENDARLVDLRRDAITELARVHRTSEWVWKDPRNCLTLAFWLGVTDLEPVVVLIHRHPLEVAGSLARRDDLPTPVSLALWERHNRAALAAAAGLPTFVVRYERLIAEAAATAAQLLSFLGDHGFGVKPPVAGEIESWVDPALRRSERTAHDGLSGPQSELLGALESLEGGHEALAPPALQPETSWVEPLLDARREVRTLRLEGRLLRRQIEPIGRKQAFGLELRVVRGSPGWHLLAPARRLAALRRRQAVE